MVGPFGDRDTTIGTRVWIFPVRTTMAASFTAAGGDLPDTTRLQRCGTKDDRGLSAQCQPEVGDAKHDCCRSANHL